MQYKWKLKAGVILAVLICLTGCGAKDPKTASSAGNINFVVSGHSNVSSIIEQTKTAAIQKAEEVAEQSGTITNELLSRLGSRLTGAAEQRIPISLSCFKVSVL